MEHLKLRLNGAHWDHHSHSQISDVRVEQAFCLFRQGRQGDTRFQTTFQHKWAIPYRRAEPLLLRLANVPCRVGFHYKSGFLR